MPARRKDISDPRAAHLGPSSDLSPLFTSTVMLYSLLPLLAPAALALPSLRRAAITDFETSPINLAFPPSRGFSAGTADDAPCGGIPLGARTNYPLSGGDIALTQATDAASVNILWTSDPDPSRFHAFSSYTNSIADIGPGHYCSKAPDFSALGLQAGSNATLLVIYELDGSSDFFYNCADLTLVDSAGFSADAEYVCGNYTGTLQVASSDDSLKLTGSEGSGDDGSHGSTGSDGQSSQSNSGSFDSGLSAAEGGGIGAGVTLAVILAVIGVAAWLGYVRFGKKSRGLSGVGSETESTNSGRNMKETR